MPDARLKDRYRRHMYNSEKEKKNLRASLIQNTHMSRVNSRNYSPRRYSGEI